MLDFAARLAAAGATLPAPATCGAQYAGIMGACGLPDGHKGLCENDPRNERLGARIFFTPYGPKGIGGAAMTDIVVTEEPAPREESRRCRIESARTSPCCGRRRYKEDEHPVLVSTDERLGARIFVMPYGPRGIEWHHPKCRIAVKAWRPGRA